MCIMGSYFSISSYEDKVLRFNLLLQKYVEKRTRIPTLKGFREGQLDDGFEGAIVRT